MLFKPLFLKSAFMIEPEIKSDQRGFFARVFCAKEFETHGLKPFVAQANISFNYKAGTVRGMHYQVAPATETKLVRCTKGAIYDVIIDMRPDSATYMQHFGAVLSEENRCSLYIPDMFAHGYQTLTDDAEVAYHVGEFYSFGAERGLRFDDPKLGIKWPREMSVISEKDSSWPLF